MNKLSCVKKSPTLLARAIIILYILSSSLFTTVIYAQDHRCEQPCETSCGVRGPCYWPNYGTTFGLELNGIYMSGRRDWHQIYPQYYTGASIYAGYQFLQWLGLEIGYSNAAKRVRTNRFDLNTDFFQLAPISVFDFKTTVHLKEGYLDALYYLPLSPICGCFDFIIFAGLGIIRPSFYIVPNPLSDELAFALASLHPRTSAITRAGAGFRMRLTDNLGVRVMLRFHQTSLVRIRGSGVFNTLRLLGLISEKPFKDQASASIGLYAEF